MVAQALEKGRLVERAAVDACVANEAVVGKRRRRLGVGDNSEILLRDGQIGVVLGDDILVDIARRLRLVSDKHHAAIVVTLTESVPDPSGLVVA